MTTAKEIQELRKRNPYHDSIEYDFWIAYNVACDELEKMEKE